MVEGKKNHLEGQKEEHPKSARSQKKVALAQKSVFPEKANKCHVFDDAAYISP